MSETRLFRLLGFVLLGSAILLLGACRGSPQEPLLAEGNQAEPIVPNLPSLSELAGTPAAEIPPLPELDPEMVALGKQVYALHCASCHGAQLEGEANWQTQNPDGSFRAPPHDANGHTWHHADDVLFEAIRLGGARLPPDIAGTSPMPAFGEILSDEEITAILSYIKSSWSEETREIQWQQTARAAR